MFLKRYVPLFIVIFIGFLTLFGHFINNERVQDFVDNDATQWFDIIASFAIVLGSLNMLKLQLTKVFRKQKNWQYSILAILGFTLAIFAGFFYRGANYIVISNINNSNIDAVSKIASDELGEVNSALFVKNIKDSASGYELPKIFMTMSGANAFLQKLEGTGVTAELKAKKWGAHLQAKGSLFSWMFFNIFNPLSSTMFALLAFFVASASYRAFRIRNFEATLLLVSGIILMLGRVPIGELIPWWLVGFLIVFGLGAVSAPWIKDRKILFSLVLGSLLIFFAVGFQLNWHADPPHLIPLIQDWIFDYPTTAGSRALMIGIALGIVATSFRIIVGIERSFLGE
jgi:hypothetical protein